MSYLINRLLFLQFLNKIFAMVLQAVSAVRKLAQSAHLKNRRKGQFSMMTFA
jgi:hypothetical protein